MKSMKLAISLVIIPFLAFANGNTQNPSISSKYFTQTNRCKSAVFLPGSLRNNIIHNAAKYGWKQVVWKSPDDYNWVSYTKITKCNYQDVLRIVLNNFPLQAVFYTGNKVILIQPRTLK